MAVSPDAPSQPRAPWLHREWLSAAAIVTLVLLPLPLLLPALNDRAVLSWHIQSITESVWTTHTDSAIVLLSVYAAVLSLRYVTFLVASAMDMATHRSLASPPAHPSAGTAWPLVSIVVPAYNEGPVIRRSIESLLSLDYPCYEVLVIDDGSTDDTFQRAQAASRGQTRVRVIRKANGGKASALNVGLAQARGTLVLNMDADSRLSTNALKVCVRHFSDPAVGAVAGNVKVANRDTLVTRLQAIEYIQGLALERRAQSAVQAVSVIGGPLGMFRREALIEAGAYDSDTFAEDRDVTLKLLAKGWLVSYEPQAEAWAESPSRWADLLTQRYRWTRGTVQALFKHGPMLMRLRAQPMVCLSLWYMAIDTFLVPIVSLLTLGYFAHLTLSSGNFEYLFLWWLLATIFDTAVTCYCLALDREDPGLLPSVLLLRFYTIFTDVAKLIATLEELMHLEMNWGKLVREGKL